MQETQIKVIGIALDNYKVNKYKKTLLKKGYEIKDVIKFNEQVQVIQVNCPSDHVHELGKLVNSLEVLFKLRN